ncbi:MAG: PilN domain-containing protein [Gammaproteobacteria bacterium]
MLNLNTKIDLDFRKFLRWWSRELAFLVPNQIKQMVIENRGVIVARSAGSRIELSYHFDQRSEPLGKLDRNEDGIAQFNDLQAKDERLAKARVVIRLNREEGIRKMLVLPTAARENLHQVLSYELSKYTPFGPEQVYFAVQLLDAASEPGQIKVSLILTPKEILDSLYDDLTAMGLSPAYADYEAAANDLDRIDDLYNLLPEWLRPRTDKTPQLIYSGLAAAVLLLLTAVIAMPIWYESEAVDLLREKIGEVEKNARTIKALQSEIDAKIQETRAIVEMKNSTPSILEVLNTLSMLIKDDTWLFYAQYSEGHLQIQGESPSASGLIAVLEDSDLFANAKFASPVTQDTTTGLERFQITADVTKPKEVE